LGERVRLFVALVLRLLLGTSAGTLLLATIFVLKG